VHVQWWRMQWWRMQWWRIQWWTMQWTMLWWSMQSTTIVHCKRGLGVGCLGRGEEAAVSHTDSKGRMGSVCAASHAGDVRQLAVWLLAER